LAVEQHRGTEGSAHPAIVCVPGGMDRAAGFRRTIRHLGRFDVTAIDRRGYAGSIDLEPSDDLDVHASDLDAVCREIDRPVVIVGHSQGALIALVAASQHRLERCVGLVAWEPPMPWFDWYLGSSLALGMGNEPEAAAEFFMRSMIGDRLWERLPTATRSARRAEGRALLADLRAARKPGFELALSEISLPTVVGRGSLSREHHRRAAQRAADGIAGAELVEIEGADHGIHLGQPASFASIISRVVNQAAAVDQ
jgi:pimeloyl-ACP methyl ester carboxylesterase